MPRSVPFRNHRTLRFEALESRRVLATIAHEAVFGISDGPQSPTNSGLFGTFDVDAGKVAPRGNAFFGTSTGFTGVAIDNLGKVWGTSSNGTASTSDLYELNTTHGTASRVASITSGGQSVRIGDLAFDIVQNKLYGITDGVASSSGVLVVIDPTTGNATRIGNTSLGKDVAIGFDQAGRLYATSYTANNNETWLHEIRVTDGSVISSSVLSNPLGRFGIVSGLSDALPNGTFLAGDQATGATLAIDPVSFARTPITMDSPSLGAIGDIAVPMRPFQTNEIFKEDFERGAGNFTVDNSGGTIPGLWHLSNGRRFDGLLAHTPVQSFYYGSFETSTGGGNYLFPYDHTGVLISPKVTLPSLGTSRLSFDYLLHTRTANNVDFAEVSIDDGTSVTTILRRADQSLPAAGRGKWLTAVSDLSAFAGKTIQVLFRFNTGDIPRVDPEGWYVDDVRITHTPAVDVSIQKTADDVTPNENQTLTFSIDVTNAAASGSDASATVTDRLPAGLEFRTASDGGTFDPATGVITWSNLNIPIGTTKRLTVTAAVKAGTCGQVIDNAVEVVTAEDDIDPSNNRDNEAVTVNCVDLKLTKTADKQNYVSGETVTFTITVENLSTSNADATNVLVTDTLPAGFTLVSPIPATWSIPRIGIGQQQTLVLTAIATADSCGTRTNTARATLAETDPDLSNNQAQADVFGVCSNLSIAKTASKPSVRPLEILTFTITVSGTSNLSTSTSGFSVVDTLPDNVEFLDASPQPTSSSGGVIRWDNESLQIPRSKTYTIHVLVQPGAAGNLLENQASLENIRQDSDPRDNSATAIFAVGDTVEFISPLSVYRVNGAFDPPEPIPTGTNPTPNPGTGNISGYLWGDINQNGLWDDDETGRAGWRFYLDLKNDDVFDPLSEPRATTDANGRYIFTNLSPGTYTVRQIDTAFSDGMFVVQTPAPIQATPLSNASIKGLGEHQVEVLADQTVSGTFGTNESPNFGNFEYSKLIRPADEFEPRVDKTRTNRTLESALLPWQSFEIRNTTASPLTLTQFDLGISAIAGTSTSESFVSLFQITPTSINRLQTNSQLTVPAQGTLQFIAFYDPAIRNNGGVTRQYPDWLGSKTPAHTFGQNDQIRVTTDRAGINFLIKLSGGSTYDSDIVNDGTVDTNDGGTLDDLLLRIRTEDKMPRIQSSDRLFDPTRDVNARCPNGAAQAINTCVWPIGTPSPFDREISLGDFGTMNVEVETTSDDRSVRAPLLDLDLNDSSLAKGNDFFIRSSGSAITLFDQDVGFSNQSRRVPASITLEVSNPRSGDKFEIGTRPTNVTLTGNRLTFPSGATIDVAGNGTSKLILTPSSTVVLPNLAEFASILNQSIVFTPATRTSGDTAARMIEIEVTAVGSEGNPRGTNFTRLNLSKPSELIGNTAIARILVTPPQPSKSEIVSADNDQSAIQTTQFLATGSSIDPLQPTALLTTASSEPIATSNDAHSSLDVCLPNEGSTATESFAEPSSNSTDAANATTAFYVLALPWPNASQATDENEDELLAELVDQAFCTPLD